MPLLPHSYHRRSPHFVVTALLVIVMAGAARSQESTKSIGSVRLTDFPINFEPNLGQAEQPAQFVVRATNLNGAFRPSGMDLLLAGSKHAYSQLALDFLGADAHIEIDAGNRNASYSNYIIGADPSRWLTHVANFGRITYSSIYPGVDLTFYGNGRQLEHDFVVRPGADYRLIRISVEGPKQVELQTNGDLKFLLDDGELTFQRPEVYQVLAGIKTIRQGRFVLLGKTEFGFRVGDYDKTEPLIIDPVLNYSTYLANVSVDMAGVATDAAGDTFLTGLTFSSSFPVTSGVFQPTCKSCNLPNQQPDVFISKINSGGTALVYSTFLGGSDYDQPFGIAVDASGNAVVAGQTMSTDFPVKNPIPVGTVGTGTSFGFISSLSPDGSALNYSSILGGGSVALQSSMTIVGGVALDKNGNAYISGTTDSPVYPVTAGALNLTGPAYPKTVAFVSKFLTTGALGYSALLGDTSPQNGGGGPIGVFGVAVDSAGSAYITGSSGTLWPTTTGAYQTSIPGTQPYAATFVTKLSPDASSLAYSTFLGDSGYATGITVNSASDEAFVTGVYEGSATGNNFPTTSNAYEKTIGSGCCASFFTEFSADGSKLVYSSYFSPNLASAPSSTYTTGIALDGANNIWLSGTTTAPNFPLQFPLQSQPAGAIFPPATAFLSRFDPTGSTLTFSTYFGGLVQGGTIAGVAIDPTNKAHIAGTTGDGLFTTPGAYLASVGPPPANFEATYGYAAMIDADTPAPSLCFNPQILFFETVLVNSPSTQTLTVTNCGNASLQISSVQSSNPLFTVPAASNNCLKAVAMNGSCNIAVVFTPTANGFQSTALSITSNAPIPTTTLSAQGTASAPQISTGGTSVTFEPMFIGQTSVASVMITNIGGLPLTINLAQTTITTGFAYTQSGCDQPVPPEGSCFLLMTFTPPAVGTFTGTLKIASNDPTNPVVSIALSASGFNSYPVPSLTSLSPPTIQAGSTAVSLQISGTNFFPASVVRVGGIPQPTTYQGPMGLTATVDPSLITAMGEIQVTVLNPPPGGGETAPFIVTVYVSLPLTARALIYEPVSQLLYASIEATAANNPNTIAVIDPVAGNVKQYIPVGNNPSYLSASDDGKYLYVALDGDHTIQRINLGTLAVEKTFPLPGGSSLVVIDLKSVPGSPQSVVAALLTPGGSPGEAGIALYNDAGLVNWLADSFADGDVQVDSFAFVGNPPVVYSLPLTVGPSGTFGIFTIDSSGIHLQKTGVSGTNQQSVGSILASDGTLLYTNAGEVWNPPSVLVGADNPPLFYAASVVPDDSLGRTFFLDINAIFNQSEATSVDAYDQKSFAFVGTVPFLSTIVYGPDAVALSRWGSDGFAFVVSDFIATAGGSQVILFRSSIAHVNSGNPVPILTALSTSDTTAGGSAFVMTVQGSSFISGSVVEWNGSPRSTTFVSATQLNANILASDIAQPGTAQITVANPSPGGGSSSSLPFITAPAPALASFQPGTLTFASQTVGTQSTAQTVTLQNPGGSGLAISGIQASGDFAQTNNCPSSLASLASCTISVTFTPSMTGARQASLVVTDSAANSPQTVALTGMGTAPAFSFGTGGSNTTSATVSAGQTAIYSLSIVANPGSSGTVNLVCMQAPPNANCSLSQPSLTLATGSTGSFTVSVGTGGSMATTVVTPFSVGIRILAFLWLLALPLTLCRRRIQVAYPGAVLTLTLGVVVLAISLGLTSCGGSGSQSTPPSSFTPKGTYTLQVVATEGATSHSQPLTLIVQ